MPGTALIALARRLGAAFFAANAIASWGCAQVQPPASPAQPRSASATAEAPTEDSGPVASSAEPAAAARAGASSSELRENLHQRLRRWAAGRGFALGHEDATAYGVGWQHREGSSDESDVHRVCGKHPAVYGWDLFRIEKSQPANGDGVGFDLMRQLILRAHTRGGINTISWHADNPVTGKDAWDTRSAVRQSLPGGSHHDVYLQALARVADFLASLRTPSGALVPIVFRPFHEHSGNWFWWGHRWTTTQDYIALFRFTVDYLRETRGLANLLIAFSPSGSTIWLDRDLLFRYPGDSYVDVMGIDHYYKRGSERLVSIVERLVRVARQHDKVPALTEFGAQGGQAASGVEADWLAKRFFHPLIASEQAAGIAYALAWRNARPDHSFLPYPGQRGEAALRELCQDGRLWLEPDVESAAEQAPSP